MNSMPRKLRQKSVAMAVGALAMAGGLMGLSNGVAGATGGQCVGQQVFNVPAGGVELHDVQGYDIKIYDLGMTLSAGTYNVEAFGWDGFIGRSEAVHEQSERWMAEFLDANDNEVGETGVTTDVADGVESADSRDQFTNVVLSAPATRVRLVLIKDFKSLNLVHVGCLGLNRLPDPTTTTTAAATTTTAAATTTTTTSAVVADTTASTVASTTTAAPAVRVNTLPVTGASTDVQVVMGATAIVLGASLILRARRLA